MSSLSAPYWGMLIPAQVIPQDKWTATQNLVYFLIVVGTIALTLGVVWLIRHFHGDTVIPDAVPRHDEIKLIYEETLSAADRVIVRDNQVIEAVRYIPKDPNLVAPLQQWRDKRREWAGEMAFLESLGKNPTPETLTDTDNAETLRRLHGLAQELEASQRGLLRAIRQSIATGTENLPLGTDANS
nr:hypothetical protein [Mobiluncus sp. Marseille-Q7826]